jgi:hypothetical protein
VVVGAIVGGLIASGASLYSEPCHLQTSADIINNPEVAGANPVCEFGFPRAFVSEDRSGDLIPPDDSSVRLQVFLGPAFDGSNFDAGAAVFNFAAWSFALGLYGMFLGRHLSGQRLLRLILPSLAVTVAFALFVVSAGGTPADHLGSSDYVAGWPIGWIVFERETSAAFFATRIDGVHLLRAIICTAGIWLAFTYVASWFQED